MSGPQRIQDALDSLKEGDLSAEDVREEFGHVDGIERSIAVAVAKRENVKSRDDVAETVTEGVSGSDFLEPFEPETLGSQGTDRERTRLPCKDCGYRPTFEEIEEHGEVCPECGGHGGDPSDTDGDPEVTDR